MSTSVKFVQNPPLDLDAVLQKLGLLGRYQLYIYSLTSLPIMFGAMFALSYVFTAALIPHRCLVPECEDPGEVFNPPWLQQAVPLERHSNNTRPSQCLRYDVIGRNQSSGEDLCVEELFSNTTSRCEAWVFDGVEQTIVTEWNLTCEENRWKQTMVGTVNNIGQFVGLPLAGIFSDRFGRKNTLVVGICLASLVGVARSFASSYMTFLVLEFLDPMLGIGVFSSGFVLGVELVAPSMRVLGGTIVSCFYALGETVLGLLALWLRSWRVLLRVVYTPAILLVSYYWLMPESVRWLISKGRLEDARRTLRKVAKTNRVVLDDDLLNSIQMTDQKGQQVEEEYVPTETLTHILKSKILLLRVINCSFCWLTNTFVFFGLALNSVSVGGNIYSNFILVALIEIPGYITTYLIMDRWGRKRSLFSSLTLAGISCLGFMVMPPEMALSRLILFMSGKFAITISFTVLYVYTTEMFPTQLRHSLLGTCAMFGRLGSVIAPQTPLLNQYMENLPLLLFGVMSLIAGLLSLLFPETLNAKLPDTIKEAENLKGGKTVRIGQVK